MRARAETSRVGSAARPTAPVLDFGADEAAGPATPVRARAEASRMGNAAGPATPVHERKEADGVEGATWPITPVRVRVEAHSTHADGQTRARASRGDDGSFVEVEL